MSDLEAQIDAFEKNYMRKLRNYTAMVKPEDLDHLVSFIKDIQKQSETITSLFGQEKQQIYETRWKPILGQIATMVPNLLACMERMKLNARAEMGHLGKGQKGLKGYRQALPIKKTFFESEG